MFDYSQSTLLDTLDLVKKIMFVLDLFIQVFYIGYLAFSILMQSRMLIFDIILVSISVVYLIYYLFNFREFYTKKHLKQNKMFKSCVRISKRLISIVVISVAIITLSASKNLDSISTLFTLLLVVGFILAVFADIVVALIDQRKRLFVNALSQDIEIIKETSKIQVSLARSILKIQAFKDPLHVEPTQLDKLKKIKHKHEQKKRRKDDFFHKTQ